MINCEDKLLIKLPSMDEYNFVATGGIWDGHSRSYCCCFPLCCVTLHSDFQKCTLSVKWSVLYYWMTRPNMVGWSTGCGFEFHGSLGWMFICVVLSCVKFCHWVDYPFKRLYVTKVCIRGTKFEWEQFSKFNYGGEDNLCRLKKITGNIGKYIFHFFRPL